MCILFLAVNQHHKYPLIVAANRDEYYDRPSQSMHFWLDHPGILAGRDLYKGGSWLGVNKDGRFCAITNFRTGKAENSLDRSRGELVTQYLSDESKDEKKFVSHLIENRRKYNPFNLVFGRPEKLFVFCSQDNTLHTITEGYHSLSNGYIDQHWPKMSSGVQQLTEVVEKNEEIEVCELNKIMRDETKAADHQLPDTGIDKNIEKQISSIFINGPEYGTRTTSYLMYTRNSVAAYEFNYLDRSHNIEEKQFSFIVGS